MTVAWRNGYRVAPVVGGIMFAFFTSFSFTAEIGFAAQMRDQRTPAVPELTRLIEELNLIMRKREATKKAA